MTKDEAKEWAKKSLSWKQTGDFWVWMTINGQIFAMLDRWPGEGEIYKVSSPYSVIKETMFGLESAKAYAETIGLIHMVTAP